MIQKIGLPDYGAFSSSIIPPPVDTALAGAPSPAGAPLLPLPAQNLAGPILAPAAAPPNTVQALLGAAAPPAPPPGHGVDWAQAIGPLAALALAVTGHPNAATGAAQGAIHAQQLAQAEAQRRLEMEFRQRQEQRLEDEQKRIQQAQALAAAAQERAREQERQQKAAEYVTNVAKSARQFTTKEDHDNFVSVAAAMGAQAYGLRPGAIVSAVPFVPVPIRERAKATLDIFRKRMADNPSGFEATNDGSNSLIKRGQLPDPSQITVQFDIDGDGTPERVSFRDLEQLAGEAMYDQAGNRIDPQPVRVSSFGEVFPQARGTVLADKPIPTTSKGTPDYSRAITDLRGLNLLPSVTEKRQAQRDAQQHARDELYGAFLEPGTTDTQRAARFADTFSKLGLNYRAEAAKVKRELFSVGKQTIGSEDLPPENPADYIERGRAVLGDTGGTGAAAGTPSTPAPSVPRPAAASSGGGRGVRPSAAPVAAGGAGGSDARLRDVARRVLLQEAQRRGASPASVTEDVITTFLANPGNRDKLQAMVGR